MMRGSKKGFTLWEIVFTLLILSVAVVPMMQAFAPALLSAGGQEEMTVFTYQVRGTLYRLLTLPYQTLNSNKGNPANPVALFGSAAEAAKENFTFKGKTYTPTVAVTDAGSGLLEIAVSVNHVSLKTMKAEY